MSIDEYLDFEESASTRHEYVGGELYAQAGASRRHNLIAMNVAGLLWSASRGTSCQVFQSDMRVRVGDQAVYYPDVMVVCDAGDTGEGYATSPCLIVEVLSPSTASTDRREKLLEYRRLPSLKAYLIVFQDEARAIRHWRDDEGAWWHAEVAGEGRIPLPCPELTLTLSDIYQGVTTTTE